MNTEEKLTLDELAAIWIDGLTPCCTNNALNKLRLAGDITEYVNQELKQRDETIKQLKEEYKYKRMDTVHKHNVALFKENQQLKSEIETLKKAFQDIFPIIDFMVTENDLHLHLMDNEIIDKARKLIAE